MSDREHAGNPDPPGGAPFADLDLRILVADDDPLACAIQEEALTAAGYRVETVSDGDAAWERVQAGGISLLITDWVMPGLTGPELCRKIRSEASDYYLYLILVTGRDRVEDVVEGLDAGADDFLRKPVSPPEIVARVRSIQRLRGLHERIEEQNRRLRTVQRFKDEWTHMIVNELRSPLLVIQGTCDIVQTLPDGDHRERFDRMTREVFRIHDMLEQMLVMAKSEDGRLMVIRKPTDLDSLTSDLCERAAAQAVSKRIRIDRVPDRPIEAVVSGDESLVRRLIDNLIWNAIKCSPCESRVRVEIEVEAESRDVSLRISDEGPEIPEKHRERLFRKYEIAESRDPGVSPHGLGLAFCRLVAEAHGGSIRHVSRDPIGNCFEVRLPRAIEVEV